MDFIANKEPQIEAMLKDLGVASIEELWKSIAKELILENHPFDDGLSEMEGLHALQELASKNRAHEFQCYLGGGAYEHYVPAIVAAIQSKSEFLTAYTPYQSEVSQGMLQAIFEFQTAITKLTGMDVANASMYDGASACAEALLMAIHSTGRSKVLIPETLNPNYRRVIDIYLKSTPIPETKDGLIDRAAFRQLLDDQTAAVLFPFPNYYGIVEDLKSLIEETKKAGALSILQANPLALALYQPGDVDIVAGDGQPLGLPLNFGGPYVGFLACKEPLLRRLPGRIVGVTKDRNGKECYVLTLQAREQHIRREKATSNICTNQALQSLAMLVTMLWYGKEGLRELALTNFQRASYLKASLEQMPTVKPFSKAPIFNEFVMQFDKDPRELFYKNKILPGIYLENNRLLIAVTETKSKKQLDEYCEIIRSI